MQKNKYLTRDFRKKKSSEITDNKTIERNSIMLVGPRSIIGYLELISVVWSSVMSCYYLFRGKLNKKKYLCRTIFLRLPAALNVWAALEKLTVGLRFISHLKAKAVLRFYK